MLFEVQYPKSTPLSILMILPHFNEFLLNNSWILVFNSFKMLSFVKK